MSCLIIPAGFPYMFHRYGKPVFSCYQIDKIGRLFGVLLFVKPTHRKEENKMNETNTGTFYLVSFNRLHQFIFLFERFLKRSKEFYKIKILE